MPNDDRMADDDRPDRSWSYGDEPDQVADVYLPADGSRERGTVALIHGGFWRPTYDRAHLRPLASALASRGHTVFSLEYRRIPGDPDATVSDVRSAVQQLPENTQIIGHSAGGHLVLWLSAEPGLAVTTIALAPVADLVLADELNLGAGAVRAFLGASPLDRPDLDPARRGIPQRGVTVIHGVHDDVVPISIAEAYVSGVGARLLSLGDCGHFEVIEPGSTAWPVLLAELDRLVNVPATGGY